MRRCAAHQKNRQNRPHRRSTWRLPYLEHTAYPVSIGDRRSCGFQGSGSAEGLATPFSISPPRRFAQRSVGSKTTESTWLSRAVDCHHKLMGTKDHGSSLQASWELIARSDAGAIPPAVAMHCSFGVRSPLLPKPGRFQGLAGEL